ncbi:hypothetical protein PG997_001416 [Apiospora hydei]|uniref:Probable cytosolic iron-sulfur protein assembly protein 1 n=1 Tax=Apiospora hydei TaxID=1337664 RepID=A0ABR1XDF7_9PEZI
MPRADTEPPSTGATSASCTTAPGNRYRIRPSPLIATAHEKSTTVFSLSTLTSHSTLSGGHTRSVRSVAWKPNLSPHKLCLVSGSFDSTAGLWRWEEEKKATGDDLEVEITSNHDDSSDKDDAEKDWEFALVLEGHDSEIKSVAFSPSGQYLATCSRDKSVWIWEDVGVNEDDDEWETVAVLNEHDGDVKAVAWCPDGARSGRGRYSSDVLASASYDDTVRIWREDGDGEWVCVAVLEGHAGTVWGLQWEPKPEGTRFPRLLTWSADQTLRLWSLKEEDDEEENPPPQHAWGSLGGIPNTMRRSLKEEWECTATLPKAHTRDVYSASWSADSARIASTGSDGVVVVYGEEPAAADSETSHDEAAVELDGDVHMGNRNDSKAKGPPPTTWKVLGTTDYGHGPFEINHVTWCKRYDLECPLSGEASRRCSSPQVMTVWSVPGRSRENRELRGVLA